jgi:hypothetical protein
MNWTRVFLTPLTSVAEANSVPSGIESNFAILYYNSAQVQRPSPIGLQHKSTAARDKGLIEGFYTGTSPATQTDDASHQRRHDWI